jgi:hypothetical protein
MQDQRIDLRQWLSQRGIDLGATSFEKALTRMKAATDRSGTVSDEQLSSIIDEVVSGAEVLDEVAASYQ